MEEEKEDIEKKLRKARSEIEELESSSHRRDDSKALELYQGNPTQEIELYRGKLTEIESELVVWRALFPEQDPRELKRMAGEAEEHKQKMTELEEKLAVAKKNNASEDFTRLSAEMREVADGYVKVGMNAGGFLLSPIGGLIGAGLATTHGFTMVGADIYEKTRKGAQEFSTDIVHVGADSIEKVRQGAENLASQALGIFDVTGAATNIADKLADKISEAEIKKADAQARIEEAKTKARIEEIEDLKKRISKKDEKIEKLEEKVEKLEAKLEKTQDNLVAEIQVNRAPSPLPK